MYTYIRQWNYITFYFNLFDNRITKHNARLIIIMVIINYNVI